MPFLVKNTFCEGKQSSGHDAAEPEERVELLCYLRLQVAVKNAFGMNVLHGKGNLNKE